MRIQKALTDKDGQRVYDRVIVARLSNLLRSTRWTSHASVGRCAALTLSGLDRSFERHTLFDLNFNRIIMKKFLILTVLLFLSNISIANESYLECFNDALRNWQKYDIGHNIKTREYKTCCLKRNGEDFCNQKTDEKYCYNYSEIQMTTAIGGNPSDFIEKGNKIYRECKLLNPSRTELARAKRILQREDACILSTESQSICKQ